MTTHPLYPKYPIRPRLWMLACLLTGLDQTHRRHHRDRESDDRERGRGPRGGSGKRTGAPPAPEDLELETAGLEGTIGRLVVDKGFGFITCPSNKREYFFHRSGVVGDYNNLYEGQKVTFDGMKSKKGPRAQEVKPLDV